LPVPEPVMTYKAVGKHKAAVAEWIQGPKAKGKGASH
jgi:hypothetical protein